MCIQRILKTYWQESKELVVDQLFLETLAIKVIFICFTCVLFNQSIIKELSYEVCSCILKNIH